MLMIESFKHKTVVGSGSVALYANFVCISSCTPSNFLLNLANDPYFLFISLASQSNRVGYFRGRSQISANQKQERSPDNVMSL